jgi:phosphate:Na+ symporter
MFGEVFGKLLAGLGLFFVGVKLLGDHMKQMTGRKFRQIVSRITKNRFLAAGWGFVSGALLQSSSIVTFIVVSLISAGLIPIRNALPMIIWSNVGGSLLVLIAALDVHLLALYLIGVTGITFYFDLDKSPRFRNVAGTFLGIGMLFLGLDLIKNGTGSLNQFDILREFLQYIQDSYFLIFVIGVIFTIIAHSAATISVVLITMAGAGLIGVPQTIAAIYGANVGSGLSTLLLSSNLKGTARQAAIFQTILKLTGALILAPLLYLELHFGFPLVQALVASSRRNLGSQMAFVYLLLQIVGAVMVSVFSGLILKFLQRVVPPTQIEGLSQPQYLLDQAIQEPATALALVEKESVRITKRFPEYLDCVRTETKSEVSTGPDTLHAASRSLLREIDAFMTDLMDQPMSRGSLERAIAIRNLMGNVSALEESLFDWVNSMKDKHFSLQLTDLTHLLAESLHVVLFSLADAIEDPNKMNLDVIVGLTSDRSEIMEEQRKSFLKHEPSLSHAEQQDLYTITTIFERIFWVMRRIALGLVNVYGKS